MAANKKHIYSTGLTKDDWQHANLLLAWSASLDEKHSLFEDFEIQYYRERESVTSFVEPT